MGTPHRSSGRVGTGGNCAVGEALELGTITVSKERVVLSQAETVYLIIAD
jgi:hypothetical protein